MNELDVAILEKKILPLYISDLPIQDDEVARLKELGFIIGHIVSDNYYSVVYPVGWTISMLKNADTFIVGTIFIIRDRDGGNRAMVVRYDEGYIGNKGKDSAYVNLLPRYELVSRSQLLQENIFQLKNPPIFMFEAGIYDHKKNLVVRFITGRAQYSELVSLYPNSRDVRAYWGEL